MAARSNSGEGSAFGIPCLSLAPTPPIESAHILVGRILSERNVRNSVVYNVLKGAWARFGNVKMTEIDSSTMKFVFQSDRDLRQAMDHSPWSVQGRCLNLRAIPSIRCVDTAEFNLLQCWIQVFGLSLDMINEENAWRIGNAVGNCLEVEAAHVIQNRSFLRMKVELDTTVPLKVEFPWKDVNGLVKWANVKFERLEDICYGCGRLGHSSLTCKSDMVMSEGKQGFPMFGP